MAYSDQLARDKEVRGSCGVALHRGLDVRLTWNPTGSPSLVSTSMLSHSIERVRVDSISTAANGCLKCSPGATGTSFTTPKRRRTPTAPAGTTKSCAEIVASSEVVAAAAIANGSGMGIQLHDQ